MRLQQRKPLTPIHSNIPPQESRVNYLQKLMMAIRAQNVEDAEKAYRKSPALVLGRAYIKNISTKILRQQTPAMYLWLEPKVKAKWTLLNCAIDVRNKAVVVRLLQRYPNLLNSVHSEIKKGNIELVKAFCEMEIFPLDVEGNTFIHVAASSGQSKIVQLLINESPQLNVANHIGWYPIDLAVLANSKESVELLVPKYLSIERSLIENGESTPLILAIERHLPMMVETLALAGVDVCSVIESVRTPFLLALTNRNLKMMDSILQAGGVKALGVDVVGSNPTHYAVTDNFMEGLEFLQSYDLIDLSPNEDGYTPIDLALWNDDLPEEIFMFLWKEDLPLTQFDEDGTTYMHQMIERGFKRPFEEVMNREKNSPKSYLTYLQNREIGVRRNARVEDRLWVRDENGETLFHTAAKKGDLKILKALYEYDKEFYDAVDNHERTGIELMSLSLKMEFTNWMLFR